MFLVAFKSPDMMSVFACHQGVVVQCCFCVLFVGEASSLAGSGEGSERVDASSTRGRGRGLC